MIPILPNQKTLLLWLISSNKKSTYKCKKNFKDKHNIFSRKL